jgi:tetratricopeptide (TPR) repeat protein
MGDAAVFQSTVDSNRAAALAFAERRLRRQPGQRDLLLNYVSEAQPAEWPHLEEFLKAGLKHRPVVVEWHRIYQSVAERNGHEGELAALYDGFLKADPANGALLYLRGRFEPEVEQRAEYYERAMQADPRLPWPWYGMGAQAGAAGQWADSLRYLQKAVELQIDEQQVRWPLHTARLGAGDAAGLVRDYRARLASNPLDLDAAVLLLEALTVSGQGKAVASELANWENKVPLAYRNQVVATVRAGSLYMLGRFADCDKACRASTPLQTSAMRVQALLAMKRAKDAAAPTFDKVCASPWTALAVSLGMSLEGRSAEAAQWRERASRSLQGLGGEERHALKALTATEPVPAAELDRAVLDPGDKALLFAVLAERFPARRAEYRAAAARFNLRPKPPYHLVKRAIEQSTTAAR